MKKEPGPSIENEGSEKPVREQLQKTSIAAKEAAGMTSADDSASESDGNGAKIGKLGKIRRKRSAEELDLEENDNLKAIKSGKHVRRKTSHESLNGSDARSELSECSNDFGESAIAPNGSERARSHTPESTNESIGDKGHEVLTSPKNKRNREQFLDDHTSADHPNSLPPPTGQQILVAKSAILGDEERVHKRQRSGSPDPKSGAEEPINLNAGVQSKSEAGSKQTFSQFSATSGFSDTSASSPFSALATQAKPNSQLPQTSHIAFVASGFGALAESSTSGFGVLGKSLGKSSFLDAARESTSSPMATAGGSNPSSKSPFATIAATTTSLGTSGFASFGGSGSGFGALNADGKKLESFAGSSGLSITGLGNKPKKSFGAADDDNDADQDYEEQESAELETQDLPTDDDAQDPRFHPQAISSGEEDEETIFSARAKLFVFIQDSDKKSWKERGVGLLKLNVPKASSNDAGKKPRLLMRAEGSQRLVLNTPITKDFKFGTVKGDKPTGASNMFLGTLPGQTELLSMQVKVFSSNLITPSFQYFHTQHSINQDCTNELMHENLTGYRRSPPIVKNSGSASTKSKPPSSRTSENYFATLKPQEGQGKTSLEKNQVLWEKVHEVQSQVIEFSQPAPTMPENPSPVASNQQAPDSTATLAIPSQAVSAPIIPSPTGPPHQTQRRRRNRRNWQQPNEPLRRSKRPRKLSLKGQESNEYLQRTMKRTTTRLL